MYLFEGHCNIRVLLGGDEVRAAGYAGPAALQVEVSKAGRRPDACQEGHHAQHKH